MTKKKRTSRRSKNRFSGRRANRRRLIALLLIAFIASLLLWLGSYLYDYQVDFYEPRDLDRREGR